MTTLPSAALLDTSVLLRVVAPHDDAAQPGADRLWAAYERGDVEVLLLDLSIYETVNVLVRRRGWPGPDVSAVVHDLFDAGVPILRIDADIGADAADIAAASGLSGYDAAFVAAARAYGLSLVTADQLLRAAAGRDAVRLDELAP